MPLDRRLFGLVDQPLRPREGGESGAVGWAKAGEEDDVDFVRAKARPLEQPRLQRRSRQAGVDQNSPLAFSGGGTFDARADEGRGGMRRADRRLLAPDPVASERANADDVDSNGHGSAP